MIAFGALAVRVTSALTQQGDQSLGSRMTRRRFAMPCSFSSRKTAGRYGFQGLLDLRSLALCFPGLAAPEFCVNEFGLVAWHPFFKLNAKPIQCGFPVMQRHGPFFTDCNGQPKPDTCLGSVS